MPDLILRHAATCPGVSTYRTPGRLGDMLLRCGGCGRFAIAQADEPTPAPAQRTPPAPRERQALTVPPSGYVARHGGGWPTHKAKARRQNAARLHRRAEGVPGAR